MYELSFTPGDIDFLREVVDFIDEILEYVDRQDAITRDDREACE